MFGDKISASLKLLKWLKISLKKNLFMKKKNVILYFTRILLESS